MARQIHVESPDWSQIDGVRAIIPVKVSWPELQLDETQIVVNAAHAAAGLDPPFPDLSIFEVVVERPVDG